MVYLPTGSYGFDSDPRLHDLKRLVLELFHFVLYCHF